jgi:hypothetical protein
MDCVPLSDSQKNGLCAFSKKWIVCLFQIHALPRRLQLRVSVYREDIGAAPKEISVNREPPFRRRVRELTRIRLLR